MRGRLKFNKASKSTVTKLPALSITGSGAVRSGGAVALSPTASLSGEPRQTEPKTWGENRSRETGREVSSQAVSPTDKHRMAKHRESRTQDSGLSGAGRSGTGSGLWKEYTRGEGPTTGNCGRYGRSGRRVIAWYGIFSSAQYFAFAMHEFSPFN